MVSVMPPGATAAGAELTCELELDGWLEVGAGLELAGGVEFVGTLVATGGFPGVLPAVSRPTSQRATCGAKVKGLSISSVVPVITLPFT